jgi:hypothetical protein
MFRGAWRSHDRREKGGDGLWDDASKLRLVGSLRELPCMDVAALLLRKQIIMEKHE